MQKMEEKVRRSEHPHLTFFYWAEVVAHTLKVITVVHLCCGEKG
jgi:hypothetical protein